LNNKKTIESIVRRDSSIRKIKFVIDTLEELYPEVPVPLDHKDSYTLLIVVLLSAQGREYSPARGWKLDKDIITKTIEKNL